MQRSSVDLPEPDGPATTIASPRLMDRSMPSRTRLSPKLLRIPLASTSALASPDMVVGYYPDEGRCQAHARPTTTVSGEFRLLSDEYLLRVLRLPGGMAKALCEVSGSSLFGGTSPTVPRSRMPDRR